MSNLTDEQIKYINAIEEGKKPKTITYSELNAKNLNRHQGRFVLIENLYFHTKGNEPLHIQEAYEKWLDKITEEPYIRKISVTVEHKELDLGWMTNLASHVIILNLESSSNITLYARNNEGIKIPFAKIHAKQSLRYRPLNDSQYKIYINADGYANIRIIALPE